MALAANRVLQVRNRDGARRYSFVVNTSSVIYQHAFVAIGATDQKLRPCANAATLRFVGISDAGQTEYPVTGDGTLRVEVIANVEVKAPLVTAITAGVAHDTDLFCVDDETLTTATTLGPNAGVMTQFVAANSGWVWIRGFKTAAHT